MATVSSVNSLKIAVAIAERQVQRDQSQVQQDASRLDQSQAQLSRDQRDLSTVQDQSKAAQSTANKASGSAVSAPRVIQTQVKAAEVAKPATPAPPKAQVNTQGETIGKLINVSA